jgi:lipid-A-disaccharide synthase
LGTEALKLFVSAGEASADLHGAHLLRQLRQLVPVDARGVGGPGMRAEGLVPIAQAEELSVMGLFEVLRHLPRLFRLARRVRREALAFAPAAAVLIDSPDFHLPLAGQLACARIPVVLYVSPQLWAWRPGRVRHIQKHVRKVLCILPFEVDFYAQHGVDAVFVGHPLVDELAGEMAAIPESKEHALALLPGSREQEVRALLPVMVAAFRILAAQDPRLQGKVIVAPGLAPERLQPYLEGVEQLTLVTEDRYQQLARCKAAFVASGTATLVCALLAVPMAVTYRLHPFSYALARRLVRVPHVGLVNLVAGERVAPELIQHQLTAESLATVGSELLGAGGEAQRRKLAVVRARLGQPGASRRAAEEVLKLAQSP